MSVCFYLVKYILKKESRLFAAVNARCLEWNDLADYGMRNSGFSNDKIDSVWKLNQSSRTPLATTSFGNSASKQNQQICLCWCTS